MGLTMTGMLATPAGTVRADSVDDQRRRVAEIVDELERIATQADSLGERYADTLAEWGRRFRGAWGEISQLGFDERFKRLWQFYLSYCEAGFRTGRTDVVQISLQKA